MNRSTLILSLALCALPVVAQAQYYPYGSPEQRMQDLEDRQRDFESRVREREAQQQSEIDRLEMERIHQDTVRTIFGDRR